LEQAYFHMETLNMYCRILLLSKEIGSIRQLPDQKVRELLNIKQGMGIGDPRLEGGSGLCTLGGSDEFLRGFSQRAIPQHAADANGQGRGTGIAGLDSQAGQPQPMPAGAPAVSATVAGREITGGSSKTAQQRAANDEIERLVQQITDRIIQGG
jgi:L-fuculose-phosphate aldolase